MEFAIVVFSFDGYSSLWDPFFELMRMNWQDCKLNKYLVTEEKCPFLEDVKVLAVGKNLSWSERVRRALKLVEEEYFCFFLDDFFIGNRIDNTNVEKLFKQVIDYKLVYVKCPYTETGKIINPPIWREKFKESDDLYDIYKNERYGISLDGGIWNKKFFEELLGTEDYNPWKFEIRMINEALKQKRVQFENIAIEYNNPFGVWNGVIQGKYVLSTYKHIISLGVKLNLDDIQLMDGKTRRKLMIKRIAIKITPRCFYPLAKSIGKKIGFSFVTDENK